MSSHLIRFFLFYSQNKLKFTSVPLSWSVWVDYKWIKSVLILKHHFVMLDFSMQVTMEMVWMPSLCLPCALCLRAINQITDTSWTICSSECLFEFFNQHVIRRIFFMSPFHACTATVNIPRVDREGLHVWGPILLPGLIVTQMSSCTPKWH